MTDQRDVRPYHAKDAGSGQETADTLAEVLQHAADRDAASRERTKPSASPKWMLPLGINLAVLAVYLLIAPPGWVVLNPIEPPAMARQVDGMRTAIYLTATRIESYRRQNGRLPETLEETGGVPEGVDYVVRGASTYQLVGSVGDEVLVYDSTQSLNDWGAGLDMGPRIRGG